MLEALSIRKLANFNLSAGKRGLDDPSASSVKPFLDSLTLTLLLGPGSAFVRIVSLLVVGVID